MRHANVHDQARCDILFQTDCEVILDAFGVAYERPGNRQCPDCGEDVCGQCGRHFDGPCIFPLIRDVMEK